MNQSCIASATLLLLASTLLPARTPQSIRIVGPDTVAEGTTEIYFAEVTYTDTSTAVPPVVWEDPFENSIGVERTFSLVAPAVASDRTESLKVSYTEDNATVQNELEVTVTNAALTGPQALDLIRRETEPRLSSRTGFSIDAATGAHLLEKRVLSIKATTDLNLDFRFNSLLVNTPGPLGPGWSHQFDLRLEGELDGLMVLKIGPEQENRFRFLEAVGEQDIYIPLDRANRHDRLIRNQLGGSFNLTTFDGRRLDFSKEGRLVDYRNKVSQGSTLSYADNRLAQVRDSLTFRRINFRYREDGLLDHVTDNDDRLVRFRYDEAGRLTSISQPFYLDPATFSSGAVFETKTPVPDNDPDGGFIAIAVARTEPIGEVHFNYGAVDYNRFADLVVTLVSPAGTVALLSNRQSLPDAASRLDLADRIVPDFEGENPEGTWTLKVVDQVAGGSNFNAEISNYSLSFTGPTQPTRYVYDASNRIVEGIDAAGDRLFSNTYDAQGRIAFQDDGLDSTEPATLAYTEQADSTLRTVYTDRAGATSTFIHDGRRRLLSWTDPLGAVTIFAYDRTGNLIRRTDPLGRQTHYAYDDGNLVTYTDPAGNITRLFYDEDRNLIRFRDALGKESTFEYDSRHNMTKATDADDNALVKTYNLRSQLLSTELQDGSKVNYGYGSGGDLSYATHPVDTGSRLDTKFDDLGRLIQTTDGGGRYNTFFEYSPTGQLLSETNYLGDSIHRTYDARDRIFEETDRKGAVTRYEYDTNDNRTRVIDPLGNTVSYTYDAEDRPVTITGPRGGVTRIQYDAAGRKIAETDPLGRTRRYQYDPVGNLTAEIDAAGNRTLSRSYDARDLPMAVADAFGHAVTTEYDALGRITRLTDSLGRRTSFGYDDLDRLTSVLDPLNRVVTKQYDGNDLTTRIETPGAAPLEFTYDDAHRLKVIRQDGVEWNEYFYDTDGRDLVTKEHTPTNLGINYEYDGLGRVIVQTGPFRVEYDYDENGNLLSSGDGANNVLREFDALNRVTKMTDVNGNELRYTYDGNSNLTTLTYPDGEAITYTYDAGDRLVTVTDWADRQTRFTYDAEDRITRIEFPNDTVRTMTYDRAGQITGRADRDGAGNLITGYRYSYDPAGQITAEEALHPVESYVPDPVAMTFNDRYQVQSYNGTAITYNGVGTVSRGPVGGGFADIVGLPSGQIYSIGDVVFEYDTEYRLLEMTRDGATTTFVNNPHAGLNQIVQMTRPDNSVTRFVYGVGLLYDVTGDSIRVYHYDHRGSTVALTGNNGSILHRFGYGPYGEPFEDNGPAITPFLFAGLYGVFTEPNGLCYMQTRFYSPWLRTFISRDTYLGDVRSPNTLNSRAYALFNPVSLTDPEGEFINILVGAVAGAIGGVVAQGISDLITGNEPRWEDYVGAAAGGAVTGALIGSGAGAIFAGAAGGFVGNLTTQAADLAQGNQTSLDLGGLALSTAVGGVGGAFGNKAGKVGQSILRKNSGKLATSILGTPWRKQVVYQGLLYSSKTTARQAAWKTVGSSFAEAAVSRAFVGAFKGTGSLLYEKLSNSNPSVTMANQGHQRYQAIRAYTERNLREQKGEYVHFNFYQTILSEAGQPLPSSPNNSLTTY